MASFLIDHDCNFLKEGVAAKPRASDKENVARGYNEELTVVTNNDRDYLREFRVHQQKLQRSDCHELFGLVIVPNTQFEAERFWKNIKRGFRAETGKTVTWKQVRDYNLVVGPPDERGRARLRRFEQCFYCKKFGDKRPGWVENLPVARVRSTKKRSR